METTLTPQTWQDVIAHLMARYEQLLTAHRSAVSARLGPDLQVRSAQLCSHALANMHEISEDKANRWLGFVQGVLICAGIVDIEDERDYTRPLFHAIKGPSRTHDARFPRRPQG